LKREVHKAGLAAADQTSPRDLLRASSA